MIQLHPATKGADKLVELPRNDTERWSQKWVMDRMRREAVIGPRVLIALLIPIVIAFWSLPLAILFAIPFSYIAWMGLRTLWRDL